MKKYIALGAIVIGSMAFAQNYPYYGNQYPEDGYYQNESDWGYDDGFYDYAYNNFPDHYYYEYPSDYYPSEYYQSYYNDYRRSIVGTDWDRLFMEFNLSQSQIRQIMILNRRFRSYSAWSSFYAMNPDRWYYDRFYALERILGPRVFVIFQNRYYNGYNPVRYWQDYRRTYYMPRYQPVYRYRNVNSNSYYVGRDRYFQQYGNRYGWNNDKNPHSPNGLRETYTAERTGNSSRNRALTTPQSSTGGFRSGRTQQDTWSRGSAVNRSMNTGGQSGTYSSPRNPGGFRDGNSSENRMQTAPARTTDNQQSGGFRGGNTRASPESGASTSSRTPGGMRTGGFR